MKETTVLMIRKNDETGLYTVESFNYFRSYIKPENLKQEVDRYLEVFVLPISTYDP